MNALSRSDIGNIIGATESVHMNTDFEYQGRTSPTSMATNFGYRAPELSGSSLVAKAPSFDNA